MPIFGTRKHVCLQSITVHDIRNSILAVELIAECLVRDTNVAVMHGPNVYFGCDDGVTIWDTAALRTQKLVEHTGLHHDPCNIVSHELYRPR